MNIPNTISLLRLLSVPLLVWLILEGLDIWVLWLFVAAGASDAIDGFIAKQFDLTTDLGRYLDPIADKALLVGVYVTLGIAGHLPNLLVILVVTRDVLIFGGAMLTHTRGHGMQIKPFLLSKINTSVQMFLAAAVLIDLANISFLAVTTPWIMFTLIWLTGFTTVASGLIHLVRWGRAAPEHK